MSLKIHLSRLLKIAATFCLLMNLSGCKTGWRALVYNIPGISDYQIFPSREIKKGERVTPLVEGYETGLPPTDQWALGKSYHKGDSLEQFFKKTGTVAFLMLKNDTILSEYYAPDYDQYSTFTTFSLAKVFVSTLAGIAIQEGYIGSLEDPVALYLEEFRDSMLKEVTIKHLMQMTSGIRSGESMLNPFGRVVKLYYGQNLDKAMKNIRLKYAPGTVFEYLNINSQLLARVVQKATGRPLATYLQEKIWIPAGMESDASWSLDHENGEEKAFCCLNARARDFARFGLLFLNEGKCGNDSILASNWVCEATSLDTTFGSNMRYQYNWYTSAEGIDFYGEGLIGQFLYICPGTETIIVRLGKKLEISPWYDMFRTLAKVSYKPQKIELSKKELKKFEGNYVFGTSNFGGSDLEGKLARITAKKGHLHIKPQFKKNFNMLPESPTLFFNPKETRKMKFFTDESGEIKGMEWSRRGLTWELKKEESSINLNH